MRLDNVTKVFGSGLLSRGIKAVDNVSFEIRKGEIVALVGESGSGKTTIGKMILRLIKPTSGSIEFGSRNIFDYDRREYYRLVQGVFQDPFSSFNPVYKIDRIFENLEYLVDDLDGSKVEESLTSVGLNPKDVLGKYPHQLSGGQLQRVLIARALLIGAKFLVADEIISMLDASTRVDVLNILGDLKLSNGMSILFITHDLSLGYYISDRTLIMYRGSIVEMGDTEKIFKNPLHPYTKMLLQSVPRIDRRWDVSKEEFKAEVLESTPKGCKYSGRCPFKREGCEKFDMELFEVEKDHFVACELYRR